MTKDNKAIIIWLTVCLLFVAIMVLVGGYTRLSGSGLSITQWKPIHGIIPPLNEAQWEEEFSAYKNTPQYNLVNSDMSLAGFKEIFWPEFIHRLLGRAVGIVFFIPMLFFALRKSFSKQFCLRIFAIFVLGGLQGGIGWIMVKSGLDTGPYVSHIKLALHLAIAFAIYALILWVLLSFPRRRESSVSIEKIPAFAGMTIKTFPHPRFLSSYKLWFSLLCIQIIFGAFMAGLHAGLLYNSWPDMNGEFAPSGLLAAPVLENRIFIQFIHRTLAIFLAVSFVLWFHVHRKYIRNNGLGKICTIVALIILLQFTLGVFTLIYQVPLNIALAHQMTALLLWTVAVWLLYEITNKELVK